MPPEALDPAQVARVDPEMDNLRAALQWAIRSGHTRAATGLALGMSAAWLLRGSFAGGRAAHTAVPGLAAGEAAPVDLAHVGIWAGTLAANQGEYAKAERLYHAALKLARTSNNSYAELYAPTQLGGWRCCAATRGTPARCTCERFPSRPTAIRCHRLSVSNSLPRASSWVERERANELLEAVTEHAAIRGS